MSGADDLNRAVETLAAQRAAPSADTAEAGSRRLEDIVRVVSDWVWEADRDYRLTYVSPRFFDLLGRHPIEVEGKSFAELGTFAEIDGSAAEAKMRRAFRNLRFEMADRSGTPRTFNLAGLPVYDPDTGDLRGYRGAASDISPAIETERQLVEAKENAELASRAKTDFLAKISHELRTPLNTIIGFADLISREAYGPVGDEKYVEYLGHIGDSGRHLLELINDLLDVTAVEAERLELRPDLFDPLEMLRSCVAGLEARAHAGGVEIVTPLHGELPALYADPRRVRQVLLNIIGNAVKFTPSGGRIEVSAHTGDNGGLVFVVSDNGIGIDPKEIPGVFAAFRQADSGHDRRHEGSGLGLYLSKRFMDLHGGDLRIESAPAKGTKVEVAFPASRVSGEGRARSA